MADPPMSRMELVQGTLDLLILQTLRWGPRHGYGIAQIIRATSGDALQVEAGSLYPALHRLAKRKWITGSFETSENNNRRMRVYSLTPAGRRQLAVERSNWERLNETIAALIRGPEGSRGPA